MFSRLFLTACLAISSYASFAQQPVPVGRGSYAQFPPTYKARTDAHAGFNASMVEGKNLFVDEAPGTPIPTNDWWTDVVNSRFSGALWSLPQMINTGQNGFTVNYPSFWNDNGTEVKSASNIIVGGSNFAANATIAKSWSDWMITIRQPSADNSAELTATLVHGSPITWFEFEQITPQISFSATPRFFNAEGLSGSSPRGSVMGVVVNNDIYGIYLPDGAKPSLRDGKMIVEGENRFLAVALLNTPHDLAVFADAAFSIPRSTRVDWDYNEKSALINITWSLSAENLRDKKAPTTVIQGFLPHAYKHSVRHFGFDGHEYLTPRGTLRTAVSTLPAGSAHSFSYAYRFDGLLPFYAMPADFDTPENPFNIETLNQLVNNYAANGSFGEDTYWGAKGLIQMALNMTFAKQAGNTQAYLSSKQKLRDILVDWLTYTPGENRKFFAFYPRWGALVGFDPSYDSDSFNDLHFHYGYFIYAGALLCIEDPDFREGYGEMLKTIAKDYANYDRSDSRFPFLRTLDPWVGHSYAGGLGDAGNDNGNGQESSSESMQAWGAMFTLGVVLNDKELRNAAIFGYMTESNGVAEYWFDRDHIHPDRPHNYDYSKYSAPYCTNLTSKGIGWWTWFSGDPLWMHSIQWMPVSPCLSYLSKDLDFVKWDFEKMIQATAYDWFSGAEPLASQSVGNVALCYMERYNPAGAAAIFDQAFNRGFSMAKATDTGHISYFVIHHHLTYGDIDFDVYADAPSAQAFRRPDGAMSYHVFNPNDHEISVNFYRGEELVKSVKAPAGLTVFTDDPAPASILIQPQSPLYIAPGQSANVTATLLDQYGASISPASITWAVGDPAVASVDSDGLVSVPQGAASGAKTLLTASCGDISASVDIIANEPPAVSEGDIYPQIRFSEVGNPLSYSISASDQYGNPITPDAEWSVKIGDRIVAHSSSFTPVEPGVYSIEAAVGSRSFSTSLFVTPILPNLALGCKTTASSEENVGCLASYATDGDNSSRWGSKHSDDQWIYVDLGQSSYITRVEINWEAAFASDYEIQISDDAKSWSTAAAVSGISSAGVVSTPIGQPARYVRMLGLKRGSNYGYSLYELRVFGIRLNSSPDDIIGIHIDAPDFIDQNDSAKLSASAFSFSGRKSPNVDVSWSSDKTATFSPDGVFTPLEYGVHCITATLPGGFSSSKSIMVNEVAAPSKIIVSPTISQIITGDSRSFEVELLDQFGAHMQLNPANLKVEILRDSKPMTPGDITASFDINSLTFSASAPGLYSIRFNDGMATAYVTVGNLADTNLALGRPASSSAFVGGNAPDKAVDGLSDSRWESPTDDGHFISVDLEDWYILDHVRILWEGAFAASYHILTSLDGLQWSPVAFDSAKAAGWVETRFAPSPARYLRVFCDKRGTAYGYSIFELEVYGVDRFNPIDDFQAPEISDFSISLQNGSATLTGVASDPSGYVFTRFDIIRQASGRVNASQSRIATSGTPVQATLDGLYKGVPYSAVMSAADAFGNTAITTLDFIGQYSIDGVNLALGCPAAASSSENGNLVPGLAVDGDASTRWGSTFNDEEWIKIDLGELIPVNLIEVVWDAVAYASDYSVYLAVDDSEGITNNLDDDAQYVEVQHINNARGGTIATRLSEPKNARFVKIQGHRRATGYGTSISEIRVFGDDSLYSPIIPDDSDLPDAPDDWTEWADWNKWGDPAEPEDWNALALSLTDNADLVDVYSVNGTLIRRACTPNLATKNLLPGIYIIKPQNKYARKIVIK